MCIVRNVHNKNSDKNNSIKAFKNVAVKRCLWMYNIMFSYLPKLQLIECIW